MELNHPLARPLGMNDGHQADDRKERAMQSQPTSVILLAEVRHAELQNEAAQLRLALQARGNSSPTMNIVASVRHYLRITVAGFGTLIQDGLTSMRVRQRTTLV
jgi:hypothetical protein